MAQSQTIAFKAAAKSGAPAKALYLKIDGRMVYLWRAVDAEGEVLDVLIQSKRNKHAALKLMRKLLKKYAFVPERLVTDDLRSYSAAVPLADHDASAQPTADCRLPTASSPHKPIALAFPSSHHQVPGAPTPSLGWRSGREKAFQ